MLVVAEKGNGDAFFFGPCGLCKWIVTADADDFGIQSFVFGDAIGNIAKLCGAHACEGHGHEKNQDVRGTYVFGQSEQGGAFGGFGHECEIWCFVSYFN